MAEPPLTDAFSAAGTHARPYRAQRGGGYCAQCAAGREIADWRQSLTFRPAAAAIQLRQLVPARSRQPLAARALVTTTPL
jgi:hypothetical protein